MGPSGSGKTTLLNLIGGLDTPTGGLDRRRRASGSTSCPAARWPRWRARHIGFVFQLYNLLPVLTAARERRAAAAAHEAVARPTEAARRSRRSRRRPWRPRAITIRASSPAARSSASASPGRSSPTRRCCSATSRPATSIASPATRFSTCCSAEPRPRQDDRDGHARPPCRRAGEAHAAPRKGTARRGGGRMKSLPLVRRNLMRRKVRTIFTILLDPARLPAVRRLDGDSRGVQHGRRHRRHRSADDDPQGVDHPCRCRRATVPRFASTPGVTDVTHANWFGGYYQDPSNFLATFAVEPESWLRIYPGVSCYRKSRRRPGSRIGPVRSSASISRSVQLENWRPDSAVVTDLSEAGWCAVGLDDRRASTIRRRQGMDKTQFLFHYEYMNEALRRAVRLSDLVGWYIVLVDDPSASDQIAKQIDAMFANSPNETKTATEKAFVSDLAKQVGNIGTIMIADRRGRHGFHPARHGQHDGAVRSASGPTSWRPENARVPRRPDPVLVLLESCRSRFSAAASACARPGLHCRRATRPAGSCRLPLPVRDLIFGVALSCWRWASRRAFCRPCRPAGSRSWTHWSGEVQELEEEARMNWFSQVLAVTAVTLRSIATASRFVDRRGHRHRAASSSCSCPCCRSPRGSARAMRGTGDPEVVDCDAIRQRHGDDQHDSPRRTRADHRSPGIEKGPKMARMPRPSSSYSLPFR